MGIDNVAVINITIAAPAVTEVGAEVVLITGRSTALSVNEVSEYSTLSGMVDAGFSTSDPEYLAAQFLKGQDHVAPTWKVARVGSLVAQVDTITPAAFADGTYTVTITMRGGTAVPYAFTAVSAADIAAVVTGLKNLINAGSQPVTASGSTTLILTADTAGQAFTTAVTSTGSALALVHTTANTGYQELLAAVEAVDFEWYGHYASMDQTKEHALERALYFETAANRHLNIEQTAESDLPAGTDTNIAKILSTGAYKRTTVLAHATSAEPAGSGWAGDRISLDLDEGQTTWAGVTLKLVTPDTYTVAEQNAIIADGGNFFVKLGKVGATFPGKVASGNYIDEITTMDWLHRSLLSAVRTMWLGLSNAQKKAPFTDGGIGLYKNAVEAVFMRGTKPEVGHFESYVLTFPKAKDVSGADKSARKLTASASAVFAGAIHEFTININLASA